MFLEEVTEAALPVRFLHASSASGEPLVMVPPHPAQYICWFAWLIVRIFRIFDKFVNWLNLQSAFDSTGCTTGDAGPKAVGAEVSGMSYVNASC